MIFGMLVCMITEQDKKIQLLVLPTRTVFTSFAQSVLAVFYNECISCPFACIVGQPAISNFLLSMSRNAAYSLHSPEKFPSSNTGVFVQ